MDPQNLGQGKLPKGLMEGGGSNGRQKSVPSAPLPLGDSPPPPFSLSPFFLGLYTSDLLRPPFSYTAPLASCTYLTPHL